MRKLTVTAAIAVLAASLASIVLRGPASPDAPLASVSPYELTLAAPAMVPGGPYDAF